MRLLMISAKIAFSRTKKRRQGEEEGKGEGAKSDSLYLKLVDQYLVDELGLGS